MISKKALTKLAQNIENSSQWDQFLEERYEGGKKEVPNPNPKTKNKYNQVTVDTALKFDQGGKRPFFERLKNEFLAWLGKLKGKDKKPALSAPKNDMLQFKHSEDRFEKRKIKVNYGDFEILYGDGVPWAEEKLGSNLKDMSHNIAKISGVAALQNVESKIFILGEKLLCHTQGEHIFNMARDITRKEDGAIVLHNSVLKLKPDAPKGLGTKIFANQIIEAKRMGINRVECNAYRDDDEDPPFIGYKVWPKMGYDGFIPDDVMKNPEILKALKKYYPKEVASGRNMYVSELMSIPGGPSLWDKHGDSFDATFDLSNSRQLGILQKYLEVKAKSEKKSVEDFLKMGSRRKV